MHLDALELPLMGSDSGSHESPPSPPSEGMEGCTCCCSPPSSTSRRSVKRKLDRVEEEDAVVVRDSLLPGAPSVDVLARVEIENECLALREALARQQQTIQELYKELEEERNSSSTAANEAMSMILRLQREKAEAQMEARQFKRFAEEKMAHDQQEILALEDVFYKRDQAVRSLSCELQAYKHRLLSYGIDPDFDPANGTGTPRERVEEGVALDNNAATVTTTNDNNNNGDSSNNNNNHNTIDGGCDTPVYDCSNYDYPPLRCIIPDVDMNDEMADLEKYASGGTPRTPMSNAGRGHLHHIEQRIYQMERTSSSSHLNVFEKGVVVGNSPCRPRHSQRFSTDSAGSYLGREFDCGLNGKRHEEFPVVVDRASDLGGGDDMSDRVYMIDSVYGVPQPPRTVRVYDDYVSTPRDSVMRGDAGVDDAEIKKLYMRLQALEADRESLKQAIISMRTDNAQLVLLREIAQNLCKGVTQPPQAPERRIVKKQSLLGGFSFMSVFKWITSFVFWKKKAGRSKYMFGLSHNNAGLLLLLDKSPRTRQWRCLTKTRG